MEDGEIHLLEGKLIIFDDWIAEKLVTGFVNFLAPAFGVAIGQFDFEKFANMHGANAFEAKVVKGALDGFALRIDDGFLGCDDDLRFHYREQFW